MAGQITTGALGLIKQGDRAWNDSEVTTLKLIAALLTQVQARICAEEDLRYAAYHDPLTGLASRRALFEYLDDRLCAGNPGPVGVLFLDLDRLKALNDFLGHRAADTYLCRIAQRLSEGNGHDDMVARLGGDEFVVVLDGPATLDQVTARAEALLQHVGESVALDGQTVGRGVSVGVALGEPGEILSVTLLSRADQAMMSAKAQGGNSVGVFTEDMNDRGERRTIIEMNLRTSIDDDHLTLEYQPRSICEPGGSSASKRSCDGTTRCWGNCSRSSSSMSPNPPILQVNSAPGLWTPHAPGWGSGSVISGTSIWS